MPTEDSIHVAKFKAKAKTLHHAVMRGDEVSIARIRPYFEERNDFKLTQAQLVVAREMHAKSWKELTAKNDWVNCSFCRKWQYELGKLIAGPDGVFVCDECVERCNGIIQEQQAS